MCGFRVLEWEREEVSANVSKCVNGEYIFLRYILDFFDFIILDRVRENLAHLFYYVLSDVLMFAMFCLMF